MAAKDSKKKDETPAAPAEEAPVQEQQRQIQVRMDDRDMKTVYANGCRTSTTSEEVLLDFGLNVPVLSEQVRNLMISRQDMLELRAAEHPDNMALLGGEWLIREKARA